MFDREQYYKDYNKMRRTDPEMRAKHNAQTNGYLKKKYATNPEWAEEQRRKRRERYARQKEERQASQREA